MLNDHLFDFWNAIWKDTDLAQLGGLICNTPCSLHRPAFEVGFLVHFTWAVLPGRTDVLPVVRSTQYAAEGPPPRTGNATKTNGVMVSKE